MTMDTSSKWYSLPILTIDLGRIHYKCWGGESLERLDEVVNMTSDLLRHDIRTFTRS